MTARNLHALAGRLRRLEHEAATGACGMPGCRNKAAGFVSGWDNHPEGICDDHSDRARELGYIVHPDPWADEQQPAGTPARQIGKLWLTGWEGNTSREVEIVGYTPKRVRIRAITPTKLGGRSRWLQPGETALVPRYAVEGAEPLPGEENHMIDFETVRQRHSLAEVARRTGLNVPDHGDVMVCCPKPDHDDSTPSMLLHLDSGRWHCFGCDSSGDVVQWVRDVYGLTVTEAVRTLDSPDPFPSLPATQAADPHAVSPAVWTAEKPDLDRTPRDRVLAALEAAWSYYTFGQLHTAGLEYLTGRGIHALPLETELGARVVGHTPFKTPDQATRHLLGRGFTLDELVDAGLTQRTPTRPATDMYRHRALVPVRDDQQRVIGLIGRYTGERGDVPKYVNPPRTAVYDKAVHLYRPTVTPLDQHAQVVVVEGTLDALAIAARAAFHGKSGQYAPVTPSGTRLSNAQIASVMAIHPLPLVIAADGDDTGRETAARWATAFTLAGRESVITSFPGHPKDPASWFEAHAGSEALAAVTRRGCLEAHADELRPHHSAAVVVPELRRLAPPDSSVQAVLSPLSLLHCPGVVERWAPAIGHELATIAATTDPNHADRILTQIATWTAPLAADVRRAIIPAAARTLAEADYGPDGYLERKLAAAFEATHPKECSDPSGPTLTKEAGTEDHNLIEAQRLANVQDYNRPSRF